MTSKEHLQQIKEAFEIEKCVSEIIASNEFTVKYNGPMNIGTGKIKFCLDQFWITPSGLIESFGPFPISDITVTEEDIKFGSECRSDNRVMSRTLASLPRGRHRFNKRQEEIRKAAEIRKKKQQDAIENIENALYAEGWRIKRTENPDRMLWCSPEYPKLGIELKVDQIWLAIPEIDFDFALECNSDYGTNQTLPTDVRITDDEIDFVYFKIKRKKK